MFCIARADALCEGWVSSCVESGLRLLDIFKFNSDGMIEDRPLVQGIFKILMVFVERVLMGFKGVRGVAVIDIE